MYMLCINEFPMTPKMKEGPALTQNLSIRSACFESIIFFSKRSTIPFAPTGNPPMRLSIITENDSEGKKNKYFETKQNQLPIIFETPEFTIRDEKKIKGKSEGIRIFKHILIPSLTPKYDSFGQRTRNIPRDIMNIEVINELRNFEYIKFVFIITLFMNNIYFLCIGDKNYDHSKRQSKKNI